MTGTALKNPSCSIQTMRNLLDRFMSHGTATESVISSLEGFRENIAVMMRRYTKAAVNEIKKSFLGISPAILPSIDDFFIKRWDDSIAFLSTRSSITGEKTRIIDEYNVYNAMGMVTPHANRELLARHWIKNDRKFVGESKTMIREALQYSPWNDFIDRAFDCCSDEFLASFMKRDNNPPRIVDAIVNEITSIANVEDEDFPSFPGDISSGSLYDIIKEKKTILDDRFWKSTNSRFVETVARKQFKLLIKEIPEPDYRYEKTRRKDVDAVPEFFKKKIRSMARSGVNPVQKIIATELATIKISGARKFPAVDFLCDIAMEMESTVTDKETLGWTRSALLNLRCPGQ
jgi:hypothetical protein